MPQKKKKQTICATSQSKVQNEKNDGNKNNDDNSKLKNFIANFKCEEIQELKSILKTNTLNKTPLIILAAILEKTSLLEDIIKQGNNIEELDEANYTALIWAVKCKKLHSIKVMLMHGADPYIKNENQIDHIVSIALETKIWDEQSLILLWKNVKCYSHIDVNFINKNGHSMLHMAVRRQWINFIEILMSENADVDIQNIIGITPLMLACYRNNTNIVNLLLTYNANVRKEDNKGFTPLCYAFSAAMMKNLKGPFVIIETLLEKLRDYNITLRDIITKKFEQFMNLNYQILPPFDMVVQIISFIIHKIEDGMRIIMNMNIFEKLKEALLKHISKPEYLKYVFVIINELFKFANQCNAVVKYEELMSMFMVNSCLDTCLKLIKKFQTDDQNQWVSIVSLQFLMAVCTAKDKTCGEWFENNYFKFSSIYKKFFKNSSFNNINLKDLKDYKFEITSEIINKFEDSINMLERGEEIPKSIPNSQDLDCNFITKITRTTENKLNNKKTKRRAKALKARIAKIKNADLSERLILTSKKSAEVKSEIENDSNEVTLKESSNSIPCGVHAQKIFFSYVPDSSNIEESEIVDAIKSSVLNNFDYDKEVKEIEDKGRKDRQTVNWKTRILGMPFKNKKYPKIEKLAKIKHDMDQAYFPKKCQDFEIKLNQALKYLCELLQSIIDCYKKHWQIDRDLENELFRKGEQEQKTEYINHILQKMEKEKVDGLQTEFGQLISQLKTLAYQDAEKCDRILKNIEIILLTHEIRGKNIMNEVAGMEEVKMDISFDGDVAITESFTVAKYVEDVLNNHTDMIDEIQITILNSSVIATNSKPVLHSDDLYLKEMQSLVSSNVPDFQKQHQNKFKTLKNAYHLIPSIMSVVDSDNENSDVAVENEKMERTFTKSRTFFNKNAKFLDAHSQNMSYEYSGKYIQQMRMSDLQNGTSRWCSLVRSLEMMKDCQKFLGGAVRISPQNKRAAHVISTGGNFTPVELGLDTYNRPLAVKRIPGGSCVCKMIKQLVGPLLNLRNSNILHYCTCEYDNNELILATPLCEYNIGQYLMLLKQNQKLTLRGMDIVRQFLSGLKFLHIQNEPIVHGNLKPSNIFIDNSGTVRVAEFGTHKALFKLKEAPNSSVIWFATETFKTFKQLSIMECTCASDIQVAGMLIHFILTGGQHAYGDDTRDILKNLEKASPQLKTSDLELQDILTWMLLLYPVERPTIYQVLAHVFFWSTERKWHFILTCSGITSNGNDLPINLEELYDSLDKTAFKDNIKGKWTQVVRKHFPMTTRVNDDDDTPTGLLRFIRNSIKALPTNEFATEKECCDFFTLSFPAFALSLYRMIENTEWMRHPVLKDFYEKL